MMERYWSETMPLSAVPVSTVEDTRPKRLRASGRISFETWRSIPLARMQPPKHIAQMIR